MAVNQPAMRRRARIMRAVNVPMRAALSLPFATPLSGNLMLISYTGRKSGKAYRQPVSYVRDGDVLLTPGGGRWTLNLAGARPTRIRLRGRDEAARPELVTDPAEVERLLGVIAEKNPRAARFIPIPRRPDGRLDPGILDTALRHGFCIVRWHIAERAVRIGDVAGRRGLIRRKGELQDRRLSLDSGEQHGDAIPVADRPRAPHLEQPGQT